MIRHFTVSLFLLASLITMAGAQTPPGVNVKLSFAENKTVYRIGEPIKLVVEFTADREGYIVDVLPDRNETGSDTLVVSPDIGITRWFEDFSDKGPFEVQGRFARAFCNRQYLSGVDGILSNSGREVAGRLARRIAREA